MVSKPPDPVIGRKVMVTMDRPLGSKHPKAPELVYELNYGYIEGVLAADGEWQDAYILGEDHALTEYSGVVIAIIHRRDDIEDKWVVAREGYETSADDIQRLTYFQEKFYDSWVEI